MSNWKLFILPDVGFPIACNFDNQFTTKDMAKLFIDTHYFCLYRHGYFCADIEPMNCGDQTIAMYIESCLIDIVKTSDPIIPYKTIKFKKH